MGYIKLDYSRAVPFLGDTRPACLQDTLLAIHESLMADASEGKGSLGWLNLPRRSREGDYEKIKSLAARVRGNSDILLVIGIGGSYLGARAGIELLNHSFHNQLSKEHRASPQVFFAGTNLSSTYMTDLMDLLKEEDFSINVVSKSGSSLETAIGFREFSKVLIDKYGEEEASSRIYVTTDPHKGIVKEMAMEKGYETFSIPEDIGGRYSVLTAVGLFPMAVSGIDIDEVMEGAEAARTELSRKDMNGNPAYQYAAIRNILYDNGKTIELLAGYEPKLQSFTEWWKQLFAESEGKDLQGIFPATALFSTDLHSIGQYIQEGRRDLFETVIQIETAEKERIIEEHPENKDGLNYLSGKKISFLNEKALEGTALSHFQGGVPNLVIKVPEICPFAFGYLTYFFQLSCALSSYVFGVNPFDQPGVESYKENMYALLGRPGKRDAKEPVPKMTMQ